MIWIGGSPRSVGAVALAGLAAICCTRSPHDSNSRSRSTADSGGSAHRPSLAVDAGEATPDVGPLPPEEARARKEMLQELERRQNALLVRQPDFSYAGLKDGEVADFLSNLQSMVARNDREGLSQILKYPMGVWLRPGKHETLRSAADFLKHYDKVMTGKVRKAIAEAKLSELQPNSKGVKIGPGLIWFGGVCEPGSMYCAKYKILVTALNDYAVESWEMGSTSAPTPDASGDP